MNGAKPRILYLTHRVPYPPDKGDRIRNYHVARELAKIAIVDLASLADEPVNPETLAKLEEVCATVTLFPSSGRWRWARAGKSLLLGNSLSEGLFAEPKLDAWLADRIETKSWDAVIVSASSLAPYLKRHGLDRSPRFVDLVDVDSQKWFDFAGAVRRPKRWLYQLEGRRVRKLEIDLASWAEAVTIVSPAECAVFDSFRMTGGTPVPPGSVAANGVDLEYFAPQQNVEPDVACAFVGALDYFPNIDAAIWFATKIWPAIHRRMPNAEFRIIGRSPTSAVLKLSEIPGVKVIGPVPDVRPHVAKAMLAVCPIRIARGLQNKVLEAMAMAKPTLAAPAAIAALRVNPGTDLLSPTTEVEWVEMVVNLLGDRVRQRELGLAGRKFVEEHHHWDRCLRPLIEAILAGWHRHLAGAGTANRGESGS